MTQDDLKLFSDDCDDQPDEESMAEYLFFNASLQIMCSLLSSGGYQDSDVNLVQRSTKLAEKLFKAVF